MSILNVNQIQPVGSGQTVTISSTNIDAGSATVTAGTFTGNLTGNVTGNATGLSGSPTLSGITSVSTSNLTVNGNAYPNAGPLSNRNLVINGAMQVAQRGTSSTTNGYGCLDRFRHNAWDVSVTFSQQTLSSGDPYNEGFRYFMRAANTSTSSATSAYLQFDYYSEAQDIAGSGWNYTDSNSFLTFSFWVRSSLAGTYYVHYNDEDATNFVYNAPFTLSANTWTKVSHSIPGNSSLIFNNDTGRGLRFSILPYYGTDYTDSSSQTNAWFTRTGTNYTPDFTENWANTASATFDITGVQLEVGSVATPFEHRSYGDELRRCQRYYYKQPNSQYRSAIIDGGSGNYVHAFVSHPVQMRSAPTAVLESFGNFYYNNGSGEASFLPSGGSITSNGNELVGKPGLAIISNGPGSAQSQKIGQWSTRFSFSAEL